MFCLLFFSDVYWTVTADTHVRTLVRTQTRRHRDTHTLFSILSSVILIVLGVVLAKFVTHVEVIVYREGATRSVTDTLKHVPIHTMLTQ